MIESTDGLLSLINKTRMGSTKEPLQTERPKTIRHSDAYEAIMSETAKQLGPLNDLISSSLSEQFRLSDEGVPSDIQAKAQELLDGFFSAEQTADRIFSFAFSFFKEGSDATGFAEEMRGYIEKGFQQAEKIFGGRLADISYETRDLINERIDDWKNEAASDGDDPSDVQDPSAEDSVDTQA